MLESEACSERTFFHGLFCVALLSGLMPLDQGRVQGSVNAHNQFPPFPGLVGILSHSRTGYVGARMWLRRQSICRDPRVLFGFNQDFLV